MTESDKSKTTERGKGRRWRYAAGLVVGISITAAAGALGFFQFAPPEKTCLSCHEIQSSYNEWSHSSHRGVSCKSCHGGTLTSGVHGLKENARRTLWHFTKSEHEDIHLSEEQVVEMNGRCRTCHESEYSGWLSGGHSMAYKDVFLNDAHNGLEQPHSDCFRCHAMFHEGEIGGMVQPLDRKGPWRLVDAAKADWPAIPCLACHAVHREGAVARRPEYNNPAEVAQRRGEKSMVASFYDVHEKQHFSLDLLPLPKMTKNGKAIMTATDPTQALCIQCHAPESSHEAGTSDDRTPRGVHEGISCMGCHEPHSNDASNSCDKCHPAMSHCGLDVKTMDTTYKTTDSLHNIHFVGCEDCHPDGRPEGADRQTTAVIQDERTN